MRDSQIRFVLNIHRANELRLLAVNLNSLTKDLIDLSDVFRASIVAAVSAFDAFVHDISRIGILQIYRKQRPPTTAFHKFKVEMNGVSLAVENLHSSKWLEEEIRRQHGWLSFQQPDKVADAIRLCSDKNIWKEVGALLGMSSESAKKKLSLIVDRRNKIAHEADMDPTSPGSKWPIDNTMAHEAIDCLAMLGNALFSVVDASI